MRPTRIRERSPLPGGGCDRSPAAPELREAAQLLYGQALLAEGARLPDPPAFSRLMGELLARTPQ